MIISTISLAYYVPHYGLIYDGGLYASLGYSLFSGNGYFFNGYPGDVPPILPIFLALFIGIFGENGIFLVVPLFSIINSIIIFLIFDKKFSLEMSFSVSYTHLDVYKRQKLKRSKRSRPRAQQ